MQKLKDRLDTINKFTEYKEISDIPKSILLEINNTCNLNCIFCANNKMKRKRKNISHDLAIKIIKDAFEFGIREIGFYMTGEPLLNDDLSNYITYAKEIGYSYIYITTNGILADLDKISKLIESGLNSIKFSINATNSSDYKFIHGLDKFDQVMNNLKTIFNYRKETGLEFKIYLSYIATRFTSKNINEIRNVFSNYCDEIVVIKVRNQSGMMPEINKYLSCTENNDYYIGKRKIPCNYPFHTLCVTCEGYLTACCTDFENLLAYADLKKMSIKDSWNNQVIQKLRKKHMNNDLSDTLCHNCIYNNLDTPQPLVSEFSAIVSKKIKDNSKIIEQRIKERNERE